MEATAKNGLLGGQGEIPATRSDMKLYERAIKERWPIAPKHREMIVERMALIVDASDDERQQIAAARVLVSADGVNCRREGNEAPPPIPIEHRDEATPDKARLTIIEHALARLLDEKPKVVVNHATNGHTNGHLTNGTNGGH